MKKQGVSRRSFLASSAMAGFFIPASNVFGQEVKGSPSQQLRFLKVGVGGMGGGDLKSLIGSGAVCTGLCDVNQGTLDGAAKNFPGIPTFTDYRVMLDKIAKECDAVCVSTADHTHATIALAAMRLGKHVYVQKPLAHTYEECEMLVEAAKKYGVVTQMGNQGHPGVYRYEKLMENTFWGDILEVHSWTDRAGGRWWKQGMTALPPEEKVPDGFNWDCWIGPAKMRPYGKGYAPFAWRGWCDFGCGAIGDMAVHNFDPAFFVLQLGLPETVKAWSDQPANLAYPTYSTIDYHFGPSPICPKGVNVYWYESGILPKRPLGSHPKLNVGDNGCMIVGSKATTLGGSHASKPQAVAVGGQPFGSATKDAERACNKLLEDPGKWQYNHYKEWVDACKANTPNVPGSRFETPRSLTEALLFGCIAQHFPGKELTWDKEKRVFSNSPEATALLQGFKREGFEPKV